MSPSEKADIQAHVLQGIARISVPCRAPRDVRLTDSLSADLNVDSLGFLELIIGIENTFGMRFEDDFVSVHGFPTVEALTDYVVSAVTMRDARVGRAAVR